MNVDVDEDAKQPGENLLADLSEVPRERHTWKAARDSAESARCYHDAKTAALLTNTG